MHLLMLLTLVDAIFLCAFYGLISAAFAPFVLSQDSTQLYLAPYALGPIVGRLLARLAIAHVIAHISYVVEGTIRSELMAKLICVGPLSLTVKSSLNTLLVDALDDIMPYFTSFLTTLRYAMIIPVVCLVAVALVSPWSAFILFCMAPLIPFFMIMIGKGAERLNQRQWRQISRMALRFHEALSKLTLVKLFNLERTEIVTIARLTKRWRVETMQVLRIAFLSALVLEFFATCGIALCAITLGFAVYERGFDYSYALFVLLLAPEFFLPLRQMGLTYHARMRALGAMAGLTDLLHEKEHFPRTQQAAQQAAAQQAAQAAESRAPAPWQQAPFTIELAQVTALYPNGRAGITDFSGSFAPGTVTALVGPSGAGKSTILQTIAGFTELTKGKVLVNGHECSPEDLRTLMTQIAYIPQLPNLFYGTLRDNLKLGAPEASDEELKAALFQVGAGELLTRFSDGLDHHIGENNRGISGGETRLIALARALVRKCPIVLLDEPTASLDRESENAFLQGLAALTHDKTVVMVAHRAELIAFAGKVIAVEPKEQLQEQPEEQTTAQPQEPLEEQPPEPPQGEPATAEADHA
ncbi:MAG: thiol reductant ABC exporter subunit CydD [Anaerobiospirillum sp.]|nr:thiol reductant ABC exporter subunit CydD [Anaerobiospirillum sp.]